MAQPTPAVTSDVELELAIVRALHEQAGRAHTHRYVWTGINGALALGSFAALPVVQRESRPDFVVGGVGSLLSAVTTFVFPLRVESDASDLDRIERLPPEERSRKLHELLRASAEDERARLALPWHALNLATCALTGGIIAFGFHHTLSGVAQGTGGFALGEAQLFTQPTGLTQFQASSAASAAFDLRPRISIQSRALSIGLSGIW
jgi:hypothetical protein